MDNPTSKRRRFLWQAMDELLAVCETGAGRPSLKLSGLKDLPDPVLSEVIPSPVCADAAVADGSNPTADLIAHSDGDEVATCWDGRRTLREISEMAVAGKGISRQRAWDETKALFFDLLSRGLTAPLNVPGSQNRP